MDALSANTRKAFTDSLHISANHGLREHLGDIAQKGSATAQDLALIPQLAGELSVYEQHAIEQTLKLVHAEVPAELQSYLSAEAAARSNFIQAMNVHGANNHQLTLRSMLVEGALGLAGLIYGLITGDASIAVAAPSAAAFAATLSATYGFSRAGSIDQAANTYGIFS